MSPIYDLGPIHDRDCATWDSQQPYGTPDCTCEKPSWPQGVEAPKPNDVVSILVRESVARAIEEKFLKPRGSKFAPPMQFAEDDQPSYILMATDPEELINRFATRNGEIVRLEENEQV